MNVVIADGLPDPAAALLERRLNPTLSLPPVSPAGSRSIPPWIHPPDQAGNTIAVDGAGNVFLGGDFSDTIDFGKGPLTSGTGADTFSARLDAGGVAVWSRKLPGRGGQIAIAPPGNLLVPGGFPASASFPSATATLIGGATVFLVEYPP